MLIEGYFSRNGIGNDLFNNAKSIKRILCPPKNAFFVYDKIINEVKKFILLNILSFSDINKINETQFHLNTEAVLLMAPHHGNLGDQAITLAEIKFLKEIFPNIKLVYDLENYTEYINNDSIIFLQGGGNLGWTYSFEEKNRREVIQTYPNNNIIILPQTIYFDEKDKAQQEISSEIYSNHSKLIIIVREKISYYLANNLFKKNRILLSPDIVTYLDDLININDNIEREGALILLRNDTENYLDINTKTKIISLLKKFYKNYEEFDNNFDQLYITNLNQTKEEVFNHLKKISKFKIVVTDRLHGMIFCVITKTSCIVIKNYNHKITSSYNWFKQLDYIKMMNNKNIRQFQNLVYYFKNKKTKNNYNKKLFENYFNKIRETIINLK